MKRLILTLALLLTAGAARATSPQEPTRTPVSIQYGSAQFTQSITSVGALENVIEVKGPAALSIYLGMKNVAESLFDSGAKVKVGQNITCAQELFKQTTCWLIFSELQTGKLVSSPK